MSSPTDIFVTGGVVREQAANGTVVATLSTEDADAGDTFTYAIVSDPTGSFVIVGNEIRVANGATLDFETAQILPITVEVTDGTGNVLEKVIGISVTDMNEIAGTADSDTIYGTVGGDIIDAGDGYDTVYGDAGDDVINGGDGGGYLLGGFGDDVIEGGMGVDTLDGNQGVNTLRGGDGNDYLYGHEGAGGTLEGGAGDDYISGSSTTGAAQSISGGDGADTVHINGQLHTDTVDLGAGDDRIHTNVGQNTITLGDGADTVVLSSVFVPPPMPGMPAPDMQQGVVTDFVAGAGGDKIDITSLLNSYGLTGFDGSINPFGSGHLRLAQDGADTLFQVDPNGSADGEQFHTLLRLQNTTATELTADNFFPAWPPDGSAPLGQTIVGTVDGETIYGTVGGDTIDAGDGYDTVYGDAGDDVINGGEGGGNLFGGFGDDVIEGGSGDDTLDGNQGANTLRGGDGNDYLYGHEGAGGTLEGGAGNDYISGSSTTGAVQSISGGDGADTVHINGQLHTDTVDLGAGDDRIHTNVGQNTITLGDGVDTVVLSSVFVPPPMPGMPQSAPNVQQGVVTDFVAGAGGDKIDITSLLSSYGLTGFDGNANPFGSGHLRLAQDGTDTVLQADLSGSADGEQFHTLLRLQNTTATELTADNFFPAWPPDGSAPLGQTIVGTVDGETIYGTVGGDTIDAGDGYDTVYGDAGDDVINGGDGGGYLLGGFGDDVIEGGSGVDTLDGNQGVNTLRGGDGNDYLYGHEGAGGTLEGGAGNDYISGSSTTGAAQSISGGDGADTVHINGQLHTDTVDLGAGDDRIHTNVGQNTITLGDGVDTVVLSSVFVPPPMPGMPPSAPNVQQGVVTDFVAGAGGDKIDSTSLLSSYGLTGFDGNANPFGSGHLRLAQDGTDTLLQADLSGSTDGEQFHTLLRLQNTTATELTADNFFPAWPPTVGIYVPNDAPTDIQLSGDSVMENTWGGVVVGTLTGTDPNAGDTLYFTLVDSAGGQFQIVDAGDAGWQLQTWWGLDHETTPTVDIVVRVLDQNGAYYNETLTITVNDAPPTDISTYSFLGVDENAPSGWFISTLQGLSSDFPDTMEFTLLDDAGGRFGLVHEAWMLPDQVGLVVAPGADIDYETATSYDITVRVSNSGGTYDETFTVQVNDLFETDNQAPTNLMLSGNQVFENSAWGTVVGYVSATDAPGDSIWYSLDDDADGWFMLVNDGMGGAQLQVSGAIDFEAIHDRDVTIRATDQLGASTLLTVPVQILNVTGNFAGDGNPNFIVGTDEEDNVQGNGGDDEIHGGLGNDNLNGNGGNDSIFGNAGSDNLSGGGGDDLLSGGAGFDFFTPGSGADVVDGSPGSAIEDGYDDRDTVGYQDGNNGVGIVANLSDEEITVSVGGVAAPVTVAGNTARDWSGATDQLIDIERVRGSNQADYIRGSDTTNFRQEQFEGLAGADTIDGGAGFDRVRYSSDANFGGTAGVNVNLAAGVAIDGFGDTDTLFNIDAVIATNADDILVGNDQRNVFRNLGGSDQIDGGGGNDAISIYVTDTFGFPGGTVDLDMGYAIGLAGGYSTLASIEDVEGSTGNDLLIGSTADNLLMGDFGDDQISALDGNDIVAGGAGSNSLNGGDGVDTVSFMVDPTAAAYYRSHFPGSLPTFEAGAYVDLANGTATNYSGGADYLTGFENVVGSFFGDILIGDDGDNKFHGLTGNDHIDGGAGTDTVSYAVWDNGGRIGTVIPGTLGSLPDGVTVNLSTGVAQDGEGGLDSLVSIENVLGSVGNDIIDGNAVANVLDGGAGADRLNGRAGADFMIGGDGNDTYFVDNVGDEVVETNADSLTGGVDRVISVVSYVLGANVETLTLSGLAVDGVGNDLANTITGTGTNNQISGEGGDDRLNGGAGADTLTGGDGNDTYYVDNAGDEVIETNADLVIGGTDRVLSTIGYTLGANVENLYLTGTAAIDGTGNELANIIYGNEAANALQGAGGADRLNGGAGADTLTGGDGSDTYYVDSAGDEVIETNADLATGGTDRVFSTIGYALGANVENLYLTGTAAIDGTGNELANIIYGNEAANALQGAGGADRLNGGAGADTLTGGDGSDTYYVDSAGDEVIETNADLATGGTDRVFSTIGYTLGQTSRTCI